MILWLAKTLSLKKKKLWTLFLWQFSIHSKIQWKVQRFSTYPLYTHRHSFLHYQQPHLSDASVIINGPTHHCHPASMVCIQIHFGCTFYAWGHMYNDRYPPLHQNSFTAPQNPLCSTHSSLLPNPWQP